MATSAPAGNIPALATAGITRSLVCQLAGLIELRKSNDPSPTYYNLIDFGVNEPVRGAAVAVYLLCVRQTRMSARQAFVTQKHQTPWQQYTQKFTIRMGTNCQRQGWEADVTSL
jgi:hypothetical protein